MENIRKATEEDLARIAEIHVFNYRLYFYPIFRSDEYYFHELSVLALMKQYGERIGDLYVYDDGTVKGFAEIDGTYVARLFVEPVLHDRGIGSALLEFAVRDHDADHLWALEKNTEAIRFYRRHMFLPTGERKQEEGTSEYLVMLRRM